MLPDPHCVSFCQCPHVALLFPCSRPCPKGLLPPTFWLTPPSLLETTDLSSPTAPLVTLCHLLSVSDLTLGSQSALLLQAGGRTWIPELSWNSGLRIHANLKGGVSLFVPPSLSEGPDLSQGILGFRGVSLWRLFCRSGTV